MFSSKKNVLVYVVSVKPNETEEHESVVSVNVNNGCLMITYDNGDIDAYAAGQWKHFTTYDKT